MRHKLAITHLLLSFSSICFSQSTELKKTLLLYFGNIPVYQPIDSILVFLDSNKSEYNSKTYYTDSTSNSIREIDIWHSFNRMTYQANSSIDAGDTTFWKAGIMAYSFQVKNAAGARKLYRRINKDFSKYFEKERSNLTRNSFTNSTGQSTFFYLKGSDIHPYMKTSWHSRSHLVGDRCIIEIYIKE